jgi:hypothetical protein
MGNVAAFFEIAAAARLDGIRCRVRLLPFLSIGFFVSLVAISRAAIPRAHRRRAGQPPAWSKTPRHRPAAAPEPIP